MNPAAIAPTLVAVGSAIGLWVALAVAVPVNAAPAKLASLRPINLNLPPPAPPPAPRQALPPGTIALPPLKPPSRPPWLPPWFLPDRNRPGGNGSAYAHGGGQQGSHGFVGRHGFGHGGGCHGGGHH